MPNGGMPRRHGRTRKQVLDSMGAAADAGCVPVDVPVHVPVDVPVDVTVEQTRRLVTPIPGPRSLELQRRKNAAVASGVGVVLPAYVARAAGGILVDVDGNHLIDF